MVCPLIDVIIVVLALALSALLFCSVQPVRSTATGESRRGMHGGAKKMATAQRKENKGNKGMFCVASVWCYCAHLNVLSDLPFSLSLSFSLPGAVLHSFAWDLLARYGDGDMVSTLDHGARLVLLLIHHGVTSNFLCRYSKKNGMHVDLNRFYHWVCAL